MTDRRARPFDGRPDAARYLAECAGILGLTSVGIGLLTADHTGTTVAGTVMLVVAVTSFDVLAASRVSGRPLSGSWWTWWRVDDAFGGQRPRLSWRERGRREHEFEASKMRVLGPANLAAALSELGRARWWLLPGSLVVFGAGFAARALVA